MNIVARFFPAALFSALFIKVLVRGGSLVDAAFLAIVALLFVALEYKARDKQYEALKTQLDDLKKLTEDNSKDMKDLKTHVSGLKIATTRNLGNVR